MIMCSGMIDRHCLGKQGNFEKTEFELDRNEERTWEVA